MEAISRRLNEGGILTGHKPLDDMVSKFFVQSVIIISICRGLSIFAMKLRQPSVIFEIIGGILMGPSAIGRDEYFLNAIFTPKSLQYLQLVANIGLVFYLFIVGMELDPKLLVSQGKNAVGIAVIGMGVPFGLGVAISRTLFDTLQPDIAEDKFTSFYVFIGTAMSITAFPVLARILKEEGLIYTKPGALVMGAAAINDAIAWCLLILAISLASAGDMAIGGYAFLCVVAFAIALFGLFGPLFHKLVHEVESWKNPKWDKNLFAITICLLFICAWTTALLGVHAIFGGFMFGLTIPKGTKLFHECNERIEELVITFMLPLYFALSGIKTDVTQIHTSAQGGMVVLVCFIATIGKFIGCGGYALLCGMPLRDSAVIMVLMNTRGLVELIVLNLGLQFGLLTIETFSVMVLMCLFTTFLTCPIINLIYPASMRVVDRKDDHAVDEKMSEISVSELNLKELEQEKGEFSAPRMMRFAVAVDKLEQLQSLMRVISLHVPVFVDSRLSVSAMKFQEPSNSAHDEYVGLAEGRLIKVEKEVTTIHEYENKKISHGSHVTAQLLPLCMFCNALGVNISAFDVRGDPLEFPNELKVMSKQYECDAVLFPWRPSDYNSLLLWKTLLKVSVPIALIASRHAQESTVVPVTSNHSNHDVENQQHQQPSNPTRTRQNSLTGAPGVEMTGGTSRGRSASITENLSRMLSINEIEAYGYEDPNGASAAAPIIKDVLCIITGSITDRYLLTMMSRISERNGVHILVAVVSDKSEFVESTARCLESFQQLYTRSDNVNFISLSSSKHDQAGLASEISNYKAEVLFMSYVGPTPEMLSPNINVEQLNKYIAFGMPSQIATSNLERPELGFIGNKLYSQDSYDTIVILHEPNISKLRRQTLSANTTLANESDHA